MGGILHRLRPESGARRDAVQYLLRPRRCGDIVGADTHQLYLLLCPQVGAGVALHFLMQAQDYLGKAAVIPPCAHGVGKQQKLRCRLFVRRIHDTADDTSPYCLGAILLYDLKLRRQPRLMAVFTQKRCAKAVYRAYLRLLAQCALAAQSAVIRLGGKALCDLIDNTAFKLGRRRLGEGYYKEAVDIGVVAYA